MAAPATSTKTRCVSQSIQLGITDADICRVFYRQPCLVCVLAKCNKDSKLIWFKEPPPQPPPIPTSLPYPVTDSDIKPPTIQDYREDHQWSIGECISYDNVGPINPKSIEGYRQFIAFIFATQSKLATRRPSSTTLSGYFVSSLHEGSNHAYLKATTTPHSGSTRPTSFTKSINADTKAPHHTNNGRTPLSGYPDYTLQCFCNNPRTRLPSRRCLGPCPITLDTPPQLHPPYGYP
jgi:hypothetical protein